LRRVAHALSSTEAACESLRAIRRKATFGAPLIKRGGVVHENFFVAKIPDSESSQSAFHLSLPITTAARAHRSHADRIQKRPAAQAFLALLLRERVDLLRALRIIVEADRCVVVTCASRARAFACQHFLKLEAVFFVALVYSGSSASRFPSARSE